MFSFCTRQIQTSSRMVFLHTGLQRKSSTSFIYALCSQNSAGTLVRTNASKMLLWQQHHLELHTFVSQPLLFLYCEPCALPPWDSQPYPGAHARNLARGSGWEGAVPSFPMLPTSPVSPLAPQHSSDPHRSLAAPSHSPVLCALAGFRDQFQSM